MLIELTALSSRLPYDAGRSSALPYDRSVVERRPVLYHIFAYLRHVLDDDAPRDEALMPALETIHRAPYRRLIRRRVHTHLELARSLDAKSLEDIVGGRARLCRAHGAVALGPAAVALGGRLPEDIEEPRAFDTLDTPENRFVKGFLDFALATFEKVEILTRVSRKPVPFFGAPRR